MTQELAIEAIALNKRYGTVPVLAGLDLRLPRGNVLALLGPNGAGKTTTVRILSTLIWADAGTARVAGFDVVAERHQVRRRISLTGQYAALDLLQTGEENLRMVGRLRGLDRVQARRRARELLERLDLTAAGGRRVDTYSGGMRRRLDLAAGLVGDPEVIFLDEPSTGLDLRSRNAIWELVGDQVRRGVSILLTTQYLDEADRLADQVALLDGGAVVAEGTPAELKRRVAGQRLDLTLTDHESYVDIRAALGDRTTHADADELLIGVPTDGTAAHVRALLDELDPERRAVARFVVTSASLDDVFLALTGHASAYQTETAAHQTEAHQTETAAHDRPEPANV